ncbi:hypothetical protein M3E71_16795, partial [Brevibacterium casei]|uniref:hypothetical protein n=1 Tax=Brevibacterium casei TaxID=33889 RepID=UPI00223B27AE
MPAEAAPATRVHVVDAATRLSPAPTLASAGDGRRSSPTAQDSGDPAVTSARGGRQSTPTRGG